MSSVEYGKCEVCGKMGYLTRTYYYYDIKCECCSPNHFEFVRHCSDCEPKEPSETKVTFSTDQLNQI